MAREGTERVVGVVALSDASLFQASSEESNQNVPDK
jgi:hypothetical protein